MLLLRLFAQQKLCLSYYYSFCCRCCCNFSLNSSGFLLCKITYRLYLDVRFFLSFMLCFFSFVCAFFHTIVFIFCMSLFCVRCFVFSGFSFWLCHLDLCVCVCCLSWTDVFASTRELLVLRKIETITFCFFFFHEKYLRPSQFTCDNTC